MTTRREPLFRFYVRRSGPGTLHWIPATRGGLPVLCNRDELAPDSPVEPWGSPGPASRPFEVLTPEKTFSDLDGATDPGQLGTIVATPGEFAARWNAWDEQRRASYIEAMHANTVRAEKWLHIERSFRGITESFG